MSVSDTEISALLLGWGAILCTFLCPAETENCRGGNQDIGDLELISLTSLM